MRKKVLCIELNKTYDTVSDASKMLNIDKGNISRCCNGKLKSSGGYRFKYVDNVGANVSICKDNVSSELLLLREENARLKKQVADLQAEISKLKSSNDDDGTSALLVDRSDEIKTLKDKFNEQFSAMSMSNADDYTTSTPTPPKQQKPPEPLKVQEKEEIKMPIFDNEQYNGEIKNCNDIQRLKTIEDICNGVLNECKVIKKNNEYANLFNLKMFEYDVTETRQMAVKKIESIKNPPPPPQPKEFCWNAAEIATNEMFLKEIVRFDEMMCENAVESHQNKLNEYKNLLQTDTLNESEYKARIEFEEKYISKVKEQCQKLENERIERNEKYESQKFNFVEFKHLKTKLDRVLSNVEKLTVNANNADKTKNAIDSYKNKIKYDLRELNDSITPDGIIYNKYAIAMRYQIVSIAQAKLTAYENNTEYIEVIDDNETAGIEKFNKMMLSINNYDADKMQTIKEKIFAKVSSNDYNKQYSYLSRLCVAYHQVESEIQAKF